MFFPAASSRTSESFAWDRSAFNFVPHAVRTMREEFPDHEMSIHSARLPVRPDSRSVMRDVDLDLWPPR